jgi:Protein of unknown function (DUF3567)
MAAFPGWLDAHFITRKTRETDRRRPSTDLRRGAFQESAREWACNVQLPTEVAMNVMYNSENYYVVEFLPGRQGIELVDKTMGRAGFLQGEVEQKFRASMADLAAGEPSAELVDEFLGHYDALLINSVAMH